MAEQLPNYQRLSRPYFGLNGTASLWLGPDHLLQVTNAFGWERYRRWYFRDIQALIARRNVTRLVWNIVLGGGGIFVTLAAMLVLADTTTGAERVATVVVGILLGIVAAGFFAIAVVNSVIGSSCTVFVQTPNGMEKMSAPGRAAVFERIVVRIRPLAEQATAEPGSSGMREVGQFFDEASGLKP